jgi:subtilisin family serine protease
MTSFILLFATLAAMVVATPASNEVRATHPSLIPTGRKIIRLKAGVNLRTFDGQFKTMLNQDTSAGTGENQIVHRYATTLVSGYAATLSESLERQLRSHGMVATIEDDYYGWVEGAQQQTNPPSWSMSRVSSRTLPTGNETVYTYDASAGSTITAYVLDTGVDTKHEDFEGRASFGKNFIPNEEDNDGEGHGSHIAGTIASKTYGIAKKANIVAVKVCTYYGRCTTSDALAGLEWILKNAKPFKSVVNVSLGLAPTQSLDDMVKALVDAGIAVICSGGNANVDSCLNSPRRSPAAFPVGATGRNDEMTNFSNWGKCIKIFAPGVGVISVKPGGGSVAMTGTSMASPHVVGIAALFMAQRNYTNIYDLHKDLIARATPNIVKNMRNSNTTVNLMAYSRLVDEQ